MLQSRQIKYFIICLISVKSCSSAGTEFRSTDYKKNNTLISKDYWKKGEITIIVFMIIFSLADSFLSSKFRLFNPLTGFQHRFLNKTNPLRRLVAAYILTWMLTIIAWLFITTIYILYPILSCLYPREDKRVKDLKRLAPLVQEQQAKIKMQEDTLNKQYTELQDMQLQKELLELEYEYKKAFDMSPEINQKLQTFSDTLKDAQRLLEPGGILNEAQELLKLLE